MIISSGVARCLRVAVGVGVSYSYSCTRFFHAIDCQFAPLHKKMPAKSIATRTVNAYLCLYIEPESTMLMQLAHDSHTAVELSSVERHEYACVILSVSRSLR